MAAAAGKPGVFSTFAKAAARGEGFQARPAPRAPCALAAPRAPSSPLRLRWRSGPGVVAASPPPLLLLLLWVIPGRRPLLAGLGLGSGLRATIEAALFARGVRACAQRQTSCYHYVGTFPTAQVRLQVPAPRAPARPQGLQRRSRFPVSGQAFPSRRTSPAPPLRTRAPPFPLLTPKLPRPCSLQPGGCGGPGLPAFPAARLVGWNLPGDLAQRCWRRCPLLCLCSNTREIFVKSWP